MVLSVFAGSIAFSGAAAANVGNVAIASSGDTVGDDVTINIDLDSPGEEVYVTHETAGDVRLDNVTVVDGGPLDADGAEDGSITVVGQAGKTYGSTPDGTVEVIDEGGNSFSQTYTTSNYLVNVTEEVIQGSTSQISGSIYEYPGDKVDGTMNYTLAYDPDLSTTGDTNQAAYLNLTSSDTSNGDFVTTRTFDETTNESNSEDFDYPRDSASVGSTADPGYVIYVTEEGTTTSDQTQQGSDIINARLNVGADTDPSSPVYKDTIDIINGQVSNADGGLADYKLRFLDPGGSTAKTTESASTGEFSFTAVVNDAGTWTIGTDVGPFIPYQDIEIAPQQANLTFVATNGQVKNFQTDYQIVARDSRSGDLLDLSSAATADDTQYEGYVSVTGEFSSVEGSSTNITTQTGNVLRALDIDDDDNLDVFHVTTDGTADGVTVSATPVGNQVTATLQNADGTTILAPNPGVENEDDAADSPASPDYAAEETIDSALRGPVNILRDEVIDRSNDTDILTDSGPSVVEVLPNHDQSVNSRIINGYRVGYDENRNLAGMTEYKVRFELYNSTNDFIYPAQTTGGTWDTTDPGLEHELDYIEVHGLEADARLEADSSDGLAETEIGDEGVVQYGYVFDDDGDSRDEYNIVIQPQESVEVDEELTVTVKVHGAQAVNYTVDATGLNISEFQVDGDTTDAVEAGTTPNVTSILSAPYEDGVPVNNGRVRLAKVSALGEDDLNETDARTQNIQSGAYTFANVQVGQRGVNTDQDTDGLAEGTADLAFTGYQYVDADNDQSLEQFEVDRGAYEELDIAPRPMTIAFDPENTSQLSDHRTNAFGEPAFTLTEGVEYDQIAFHLTFPNGTAVDLTDGYQDRPVGLNELASATTDSGEPFISITGPVQEDSPSNARILFNESQSNASAGYYVIDDVEREYWIHTDEANNAQDLNQGGSFSFSEGYNPSDRNQNTYRLTIEHPTRSFASAQNVSTGYFSTFPPKIDTDIRGVNVTRNGVPQHVAGDNFQGADDVESVTTDIGRWYRVDAQLHDYFGTPVNGTVYDETYIQEDFSVDDDDADVEFLETMGNTRNNPGLELNNESGRFQFDIQPEEADPAGQFDTDYLTHILKTDGTANNWATEFSPPFPFPTTHVRAGPNGTRPVVQVYDQSGAKLPRASDTGNLLLANDVKQTLRVEAFPSDPDDLPLPRRTYQVDTFANPVQENTISSETNLRGSDTLVTDNDDYLNIPYEQGQVGFITLTPTGTGDEVIQLRDINNFVVLNVSGNPLHFDVNRSNKEVSLSLSSESVTPGGSVTVEVAEAATGDPIGRAGVSLSDTNGNVIATETTNESGMVTISVPESAQLGSYTLETRPAGFQPVTSSFTVRSPAQLNEDLTLVPREGQVISGQSSADAGTTYTIQINGPGVIESADAEVQDDGTFSAEFDLSDLSAGDELTAEISGVDSVTYTLQSPPTSTISIRSQVSQQGNVVNVREVFLPEGGYVVIHNASTGDVIGHTAYFEPGTYDDVDVLLDQQLSGGSNQVIAMSHLDTDGDQQYEFPDADGPYTQNGNPVIDTASVQVPIEPASFEVSNLNAPSTVTQGDDVTASVTIENTGGAEATQTVEFRFAGETVAQRDVTLAGGESVTEEFTVSTEGVEPGTYTHGVFSDDDSATRQLTIEAPPTTTPEPTTTTTTTTEEPTTTDTGDGDGPGFGVIVALVALVAAALLAVRRNN